MAPFHRRFGLTETGSAGSPTDESRDGFAVVANEVDEIAATTEEQTQQVQETPETVAAVEAKIDSMDR